LAFVAFNHGPLAAAVAEYLRVFGTVLAEGAAAGDEALSDIHLKFSLLLNVVAETVLLKCDSLATKHFDCTSLVF
jgi:hypothetical protein